MAVIKKQVVSSVVKALFYNDETQELTVEFKSGSKYRYDNVDQEEFDSFAKAVSKGKYFNKNVKNNYDYEKVASLIHGGNKMEWLSRKAENTPEYTKQLDKIRVIIDRFAHECTLDNSFPETLKPAEEIMKICGWEE